MIKESISMLSDVPSPRRPSELQHAGLREEHPFSGKALEAEKTVEKVETTLQCRVTVESQEKSPTCFR